MPHTFDCPQPLAWESTKVIKLGPWGQGTRRFAQVAVVDDQLVLVQEQEEESDWGEVVDWDALKAQGHFTEGNVKRNASMFLLLDPKSPWRAQLPRPETHVRSRRLRTAAPRIPA